MRPQGVDPQVNRKLSSLKDGKIVIRECQELFQSIGVKKRMEEEKEEKKGEKERK